MNRIIALKEIRADDRPIVGGKAYALWRLAAGGFKIPETVCVTSGVYQEFLKKTGLHERILLELHRKDFKEMRWEEIWDCATRIRNMFLTQRFPEDLYQDLRKTIGQHFRDRSVAVRSSAPDEDDAHSSFAGLHESYVNLMGVEAIIKHIRLVWASLWSDAALLYRQEIGLDVQSSTMAVVVQETIAGDRSGVVFTRNPNDTEQAVIESVHGLNQGLVDGDIEPDRWLIDRATGSIVSHTQPERRHWIIPGHEGVERAPLPVDKVSRPPLNEREVKTILATAVKAEEYFKAPQDVEWTDHQQQLTLLQSRPITTLGTGNPEDQRGWYLSLHRSFDNLKELRRKIEDELIPAMVQTAEDLGKTDLGQLSEKALVQAIRHRWEVNHKWVNVYWADFIPYAHGVRLFGQVYNDAVQPKDPYEFIDLLTNTDMASLARNNMLFELAAAIRQDKQLRQKLKQGNDTDIDPDFMATVEAFIEKFGDLSCAVTGGKECVLGTAPLFRLLLELAEHPPPSGGRRKRDLVDRLQENFLNRFEDKKKARARELLDLARSSYRLRDDDNIYLGRIEAQLLAAVQEAKRRLREDPSEALQGVLEEIDFKEGSNGHSSPTAEPAEFAFQARQLTGQPSGPGIAQGKARVIRHHNELSEFKSGEILVCDAVDPNMTFVVPLAAAVIERRGGMLIHGAIIAREYGLPCITGVPGATSLINTNDDITVDGYLGIVTIGETGELAMT
jgi:phosphoenolpyruvate synthase/pyruvate phosphate dikinase